MFFMLAAAGGSTIEARGKSSISAEQQTSALNVMLPKRLDLVVGGKIKTGGKVEAYSANIGARFLFREAEIKTAYTIPETRFSSRPDYQNPVFGLRLSLKEAAGVPLELKGGNLTLGGSFRRLKNPRLTENAYALGQASYAAAGLEIFLPSFSAAQKPYGVGADVRVKGKSAFKDFDTALFYGENGVFAASSCLNFRIGGQNSAGFSFTAAQTAKKRSRVVCFGDDIFDSSGRKWNFCVQSTLQSSFYRASASVCVFEGVKGDWMPAFTFENGVKVRFFTLNTGAFYVPRKDTVSASLVKQRTIAQFKVNPQTSFYFFDDSVRIKTGALLLLEEKRKTARTNILTAKAGLGGGIDIDKTSVRVHFKVENCVLSSGARAFWERGSPVLNQKIFDGVFYTVSASFSQKSGLKPFCAASCVFSPKYGSISETAQYNAAASIRIPAATVYAPSVYLGAGGSVKTRGGALAPSSVKAQAVLTWKTRGMTVSGSARLTYEFR